MSVEPMKKAAQALELLLRSLPEDCYFNVISFGSRHDSLFPKSQIYSEDSLSKALSLAQTMTSNYGGTEIYSALKWSLKVQEMICQLLYSLSRMAQFEH